MEYSGLSISHWAIKRIVGTTSYTFWDHFNIQPGSYHGTCDTMTPQAQAIVCSCVPLHSGDACSTINQDVHIGMNDIVTLQYGLKGIREVAGNLTMFGLGELWSIDPAVFEEATYGLEKVTNLIIHAGGYNHFPPVDTAFFPRLTTISDTFAIMPAVNDFRYDGLTYRFPLLTDVGNLMIRDYRYGTLQHANPVEYKGLDLSEMNWWGEDFDFWSAFGHLQFLDHVLLSNINNMFDFSWLSQVLTVANDLTITEMPVTPTLDGFYSLALVGRNVRVYNNTMMQGPFAPISNNGPVNWLFSERNGPCGVPDWSAVC